MEIKSGAHLGIVRSWIQRKARNGETVIWGSDTYLELAPIAVRDMEWLAQDVRNAVIKEVKDALQRDGFYICKNFEVNIKSKTCNDCKHCGHTRLLHEILNIS